MTKTTNYNLNQWEAEDAVRREDFNADNAAIDAALKTIANSVTSLSNSAARIAFGSYTGTGAYGSANPVTLTFAFQPKLVAVQARDSVTTYTQSKNQLFFLNGAKEFVFTDTWQMMKLTWSGNTVSWYSPTQPYYQLNSSGTVYLYFAIG